MADGGWRLDRTKWWCSGGHLLDSTVVTAHADDRHRLFVIELDAPGIDVRSDLNAVGMRGSDTVDVDYVGVLVDRSAAVGDQPRPAPGSQREDG